MFSSVSIVLVGNSSLSSHLRALVCLELFLHHDFYAKHPIFSSVLDLHPGLYDSIHSLLFLSVSDVTFNSHHSEFIKQEAIAIMCNDKAWSSFACVFALSSILKRTISMNYPDFNPIKYRVLFNQTVMSRSFHENGEKDMEVEIKLLYCNLRPSSTCDFFANHFVPLVKKKTDKKSVKSLNKLFPFLLTRTRLNVLSCSHLTKLFHLNFLNCMLFILQFQSILQI